MVSRREYKKEMQKKVKEMQRKEGKKASEKLNNNFIRNNFDEGKCEITLKYILIKLLPNKEKNKAIEINEAIDRIKNHDTKFEEIFNRPSQQFNPEECLYAIKDGLAHEGYSNTKIEDIIQVAGKVPESVNL